MGHAYAYRCDHCGYSENFNQGHGFMVHSQNLQDYVKQPRQVFHYKTHEVLKKMAEKGQQLYLKAGFQIYKCPHCKTLHDKVEVTVFDDERVVHKSEFRCPACRSRLKLTNIHRLKKAICPKCHRRTFHRAYSMPQLWD